MAKIAAELERALIRRAATGASGETIARSIARGSGWSVEDVLCTSGPWDRSFEEQHSRVAIAIVTAGSFQYASRSGRELMTPGSLLLGSPGQCFECGHEHGAGDRCLSFLYAPDYFERLATDAGIRSTPEFRTLRLPPLRELAPIVSRAFAGVSRAFAGLTDFAVTPWEELSVLLAARSIQLSRGHSDDASRMPLGAEARVTRTVRAIDRAPRAAHTLASLAAEARLSPYHFLRTFQRLTGLTPHQYVLRTRLREAAIRLEAEREKILDIALDGGFGDVSNFNRGFRAEFGVSPRAYRKACGNSAATSV